MRASATERYNVRMLWQWYDLLAGSETRTLLLSASALLGVAAPGILFQATSVSLRGMMRLVLALTVPIPVVATAIVLGLARLQRGMGCGNFADDVMRAPAEYVEAFTLGSLSSAWPWIAGASLLGACVSPSLLALAQSLDRD